MAKLKTTALLLLAVLAACRDHDVSINGQNLRSTANKLKVPPVAVPIEIAGALAALRTYYQTRSVIRLKVASNQISLGDQLELLNDSTKTSLLKTSIAPLTDEDEAPAFSLLDQGYDLTLTIYPLDASYKDKFSYGTNHLRLLVGQTAKKFAGSDITLKDFRTFGVGASSPADQAQGPGGFQGRVSFLSNPIITNNTDEITTGLIGVTSH